MNELVANPPAPSKTLREAAQRYRNSWFFDD